MILVTVTSDWVPELIGELPDIVLEENSTIYDAFDLDDYFIDRDHDSLFFSSGYFNIIVDIKENNSVDITAIGQWIGNELVTFRAEDPIGAIVEDTITVTVIPRNDGPVISGVPDLVVHFDYPYSFDLSPYIYDLDNNTAELMVWTSEAISNIWIQYYNNLGIVVKYPESMNGITIPVTIYVSDGIEIASQRIQISVTDDFPPELIYKLPDIVFEEDTVLENAFILSNYFLDIDGDALYYTNGTKFINAIINDNLTVDFSAPENWYGSEIVTFRATDPHGALVEDKILVVVVPVNDPPTISGIPDQDMREEDQWILDLSQYIFDVDNHPSELIITKESQFGQDFVILVGTILIFQYPEDIQYDMVMVTVSDGQLESNAGIRIGTPSPIPGPPSLWDQIPWPWVLLSLLVVTGGAFAFHKKRSRYWVYEAFLIHEDGLPIAHASHKESEELENVVVSGMFTAVQDFVNDVFSGKTEGDWEVDEMKFGDNKILIEKSPNLFLAVIFEGNGNTLRNRVKKLLLNINEEYGAILEDWDGDLGKLTGLSTIIGSLIPKKAPKRPDTKDLEAQSEISSEEFEDGSRAKGGTNKKAGQSDQESQEKVKETSPEIVEVEEMEVVGLLQCPVCGKELERKDAKCPRCDVKFARK